MWNNIMSNFTTRSHTGQRRRRIILSVATVGLLAAILILAACGSTPSEEAPDVSPTSTAEDTSADTSEEVPDVAPTDTPEDTSEDTTEDTSEDTTPEEEPMVEDSKSGGVLVAAYQADPVGFDPGVVGAMSSYLIIEQVYDTLVEYDGNMGIVPALAESWDVSDDNLEIVFNLNQGVLFHSGEELTAEDVKFTFDRIKDPDTGSPRMGVFENLDSVEAVDDYTVKFTFNTPMGPFFAHLASPAQSIVQAGSTIDELQTTMNGTGPFIMTSYEPKNKIVLEKNENFWMDGLPYLDGVEIRFIEDETAATNAFMTENVDLLQFVATKDMEMLEAIDGVVSTPLTTSCQWNYTGINTTREPFTDPNVRYAMALAKDRGSLIDTVYFGYGTPVTGDITPDWTGGNSGREYFSPEPDVEKAKQLLADAGYPDGFDTTIKVSAQYPWHLAAAEMYQADLAKIGVNAELITMEWGAFLDDVFGNQDFDLQHIGWGGPFVDPDEFLYPEFHSGEAWNPQGFNDPEVDQLLEDGRNTLDPEKREEIYFEVQKLIAERAPVVAGVNVPFLQAHWDNVNDFVFLPTGMLRSFRDTWLSE